ncbi:MAG: hypothetical protein IJR70_04810 [Eubacterium sp.]|nr:hypothetical protein [Eubacterium sp.]
MFTFLVTTVGTTTVITAAQVGEILLTGTTLARVAGRLLNAIRERRGEK